jgi:protein SCO1
VVTGEYAIVVDLDEEALERVGDRGGQAAYRDLRRLFKRRGLEWKQDGLYSGAADPATVVLAAQEAARELLWFAAAVRAVQLLHIGEQSDLMPTVVEAARDRAASTMLDDPAVADQPRPSRGLDLRRRDFIVLAVLLAVVALVSVVVIRGPGRVKGPGGVAAAHSTIYDGLAMPSPWRLTPPLALHNYIGTPVNITSYRGKAVLVTFLYVHCPNVCPIITSKLHTALQDMSPTERSEVQIIAVSVDPRGDTPAAVAKFLADHEMTGRMQYLIGTLGQLGPVWKNWYVGSERESDPELVAHTALVYGVTASGKIATLYQSSFNPSQIVHDVPLLART